MEATNYRMARLVKTAVKFDNDYKEGTVTVSSLDNMIQDNV